MATYSLDELYGKLERAVAAGDAEAASVIADEIRRMDGSPANPFANVRGSVSTAPAQPQRRTLTPGAVEDPTDGMSGFQRAAAGFGKSFVDSARGAAQAGLDFANLPTRAVRAVGLPAPETMGERWAEDLRAKQAEVQQRDAPLMDTWAGIGGNILGYGTQLLTPAALARGTPMVAGLLPNTIRGNIAQGAGLGALQPVADSSDRVSNAAWGAGGGGAGAAMGRAIGAGAHWAREAGRAAMLGPVDFAAGSQILREAGGAQALPGLLNPQPSAIPGVARTLAEESLNPGVMSLENTMRGRHAGVFMPRENANNLARVNALQGIAGTDADRASAVAARDAASAQLLRTARGVEGIDTNRLISQVGRLARSQEGRPAVQKALLSVQSLLSRDIPDAERLKAAAKPLQDFIATDRLSATNREAAKEALKQVRAGERPTATFTSGGSGTAGIGRSYDAARDALSSSRKAFDREATGHDKLSTLYNVRKTINDMLAGKYGGDDKASLAGSRELIAVRNQLDRVLGKASPEFTDYLNAYRTGSKPINRMDLGRELIESGSAGIRDEFGTPRILPGTFAKANDLDPIAQRATGFGKAKAEDILTPTDLKLIVGIQDDLQRTAAVGRSLGGGSQTNARGEIGKRIGKTVTGVMPGWLGRMVEGAQAAGERNVQEKLAFLLANPAEARIVLARLKPAQQAAVTRAMAQLRDEALRSTGQAIGLNRAADQPLEIDIVGGTRVPASQLALPPL